MGTAAAVLGIGGSAGAGINGPQPGLACFYECKERNSRIWDEITTLMVTNPSQSFEEPIILFWDGNENVVAGTRFHLSPFDLDEINVCRTLEAAEFEVPEAGLITITTFTNRSTSETPIRVWVKNLLGRFNKRDDEPFDGKVQAIAKVACQEAQATLPEEEGEPPFAEPVLVEDTFEESNGPR